MWLKRKGKYMSVINETLFCQGMRHSVVLTDVSKKLGEEEDFQLFTVTQRGRLLTGAQTNSVEVLATPLKPCEQ